MILCDFLSFSKSLRIHILHTFIQALINSHRSIVGLFEQGPWTGGLLKIFGEETYICAWDFSSRFDWRLWHSDDSIEVFGCHLQFHLAILSAASGQFNWILDFFGLQRCFQIAGWPAHRKLLGTFHYHVALLVVSNRWLWMYISNSPWNFFIDKSIFFLLIAKLKRPPRLPIISFHKLNTVSLILGQKAHIQILFPIRRSFILKLKVIFPSIRFPFPKIVHCILKRIRSGGNPCLQMLTFGVILTACLALRFEQIKFVGLVHRCLKSLLIGHLSTQHLLCLIQTARVRCLSF